MAFTYNSIIKDVQNRLVAQSIRETSNAELLKSEEAIKAVFQSYSDRFAADEGKLFDAKRYLVKSKDIIRVSYFNNLFETIYMDLTALYADLDLVSQVLNLNVSRNKSYFLVIKKRLKDLWNKLAYIRTNIYDSNPSDESYYESFNGDINAKTTKNIMIDKKTGYLHLEPIYKRVYNHNHHIKSITCTTYPEHNDEGGVDITTNVLNTFTDNYENGPRDMMENGLWKEEVICSDVPRMTFAVGTSGAYLRNFHGIVSMVDVEYNYPVEINRIDIDLFGEHMTNVAHILYKGDEDDTWEPLTWELDQDIDNSLSETELTDEDFDVVTFYNIKTKTVKSLRFVMNQKNFEFLSSEAPADDDVNKRIMNDLAERRYELIKFGSNIQDQLSVPQNDENTSLYYQIVSIIESTRDVAKILSDIDDLLNPKVNIISYDFAETLKYEIGAWSFEPKIEKYVANDGIYESKPYKLKDRALISATLMTQQSTPSATTCNWYININGRDIPILPEGDIYTKESIYPYDMSTYGNLDEWVSGTFVLLDFPIDPNYTDTVGMYTNSETPTKITQPIVYLNSRLLFFKDIIGAHNRDVVVKYIPARDQAVNLYVLTHRQGATLTIPNLEVGIVSTRKEVLQSFLDELIYRSVPVNTLYSISNALSTRDEAEHWFGKLYTRNLFIDRNIYTLLKWTGNFNSIWNNYSSLTNLGFSKMWAPYSGIDAYIAGTGTGFSNFKLIGDFPNIAPIAHYRIIQ